MSPDAAPDVAGAGVTAVGGRARNEDAFIAEAPVFVVADGMGGHVAGAEAAWAAIAAFQPLAGSSTLTPDDVARAHLEARRNVAAVQSDVGAASGTTLTGAIAVVHGGSPWWMVVNVGDSRTYALDGGELRQVTVDHSHVQDLVDAGRITAAQALVHPDRNILTRAIGDDILEMDAWLVPQVPGRRLIVASDGLMKEVEDREIGEVAGLIGDAGTAAAALVDLAVGRGATDNVTVVIADATSTTPRDADPAPWPVWGADAHEDTTPSARRRGGA
ncbi:protein phosphatase 2C domain-containing protein [Demequina sp. SYSU T00192]|uniref:Protein phosphatase 2C domain-containing protein n=1 Tax=Demequina litoralis TaxID=3051660 RepID=A0ABT8GA86_9MICO|nr:protein phosphatase 2C domain-containing protein [Demequina sp. SYSU T00192]MDN4476055.1 protein phosphatase 2C domain-containing protein [Demequina sp. SYSU T00192]